LPRRHEDTKKITIHKLGIHKHNSLHTILQNRYVEIHQQSNVELRKAQIVVAFNQVKIADQ